MTLRVGDRVLLWTYEEMSLFPNVVEMVSHLTIPRVYLSGGCEWGGYPLYKDLYTDLHSVLRMTKDKATTLLGIIDPWQVYVEYRIYPLPIVCIKGVVGQADAPTPKIEWRDLRLIRQRVGGKRWNSRKE